jgi:hypothetical protein
VSREIVIALLHMMAPKNRLALKGMTLFRSLRRRLDPLDREILERTFDAALATVKSDLSVEFGKNKDLEALLRRELIEIACVTGVSDPEKLQELLLARLPSMRPAATAG